MIMEKILEIQHLEKHFGDHIVLKDISFSVEKGDVICIIGSSGNVKATRSPIYPTAVSGGYQRRTDI